MRFSWLFVTVYVTLLKTPPQRVPLKLLLHLQQVPKAVSHRRRVLKAVPRPRKRNEPNAGAAASSSNLDYCNTAQQSPLTACIHDSAIATPVSGINDILSWTSLRGCGQPSNQTAAYEFGNPATKLMGGSLPSVLWLCWLGHLTRKNPSPDMTYNVFSGMLNPTQAIIGGRKTFKVGVQE